MTTVYSIKTDLQSATAVSALAYGYVVQLAAQALGVPRETIQIRKTEYGKPYIDGVTDWHFSLSHTDGKIAIAVSDQPIGVDIEKRKKNNLKIAEHCFMPSERDYINSAETDAEKQRRFLEVWTRKEAYVKLTGEGLRRGFRTFSVLDAPASFETIESEEYILTVCTAGQETVTVRETDFADMGSQN